VLVLSRKKDETIIIGDSIVITVISIKHDFIRLGIEAPPEVPILRHEVSDPMAKARGFPAQRRPKAGRFPVARCPVQGGLHGIMPFTLYPAACTTGWLGGC
jgi:carbon storage regulator